MPRRAYPASPPIYQDPEKLAAKVAQTDSALSRWRSVSDQRRAEWRESHARVEEQLRRRRRLVIGAVGVGMVTAGAAAGVLALGGLDPIRPGLVPTGTPVAGVPTAAVLTPPLVEVSIDPSAASDGRSGGASAPSGEVASVAQTGAEAQVHPDAAEAAAGPAPGGAAAAGSADAGSAGATEGEASGRPEGGPSGAAAPEAAGAGAGPSQAGSGGAPSEAGSAGAPSEAGSAAAPGARVDPGALVEPGSAKVWRDDTTVWAAFDTRVAGEVHLRYLDGAGVEALKTDCATPPVDGVRRCEGSREADRLQRAVEAGAAPGRWTVQGCAGYTCVEVGQFEVP